MKRGQTVRERPKPKKKPDSPGKILITAGPTIEPLDPVRYLSNRSTGTMGYEIAAEGKRRGFSVCLVSGPVCLRAPSGMEVVKVTTALEMKDRVLERIEEYDGLIMTAAVCDFRPEKSRKHKIKKRNTMTLRLVKNPDILQEVSKQKALRKIGFALETKNPIKNGRDKLKAKKLDLIIINTAGKGSDPFGPGEGQYTIMDADGNSRKYKKITKKQMSKVIINELGKMLR